MNDETYIRLALEIAKKGVGFVSPNPLVGCVIIKNKKIIGAGYHEKIGNNHAEINAIKSAKEDLEGSTLYVNLEPCSHFGKTPPCVDEIIKNKIKRVVVGTLDANPIVNGQGIKKLKQAGIDVEVGILEKECTELNKFYFKFINQKIPYVTLKAAQTIDGKIADSSGDSKWVSSLESRKYVHQLRSVYDAVLVGYNTLLIDNPNLNVRFIEGRNPKKIILDSKLRISTDKKIFSDKNNENIIIVTSQKSKTKTKKLKSLASLNVSVVFVDEDLSGNLNLKKLLKILGKKGITSLLVEGGSKVYSYFIKQKLFDDFLVFVCPKILGSGLPVANNLGVKNIKGSVKLKLKSIQTFGDDVLIEFFR